MKKINLFMAAAACSVLAATLVVFPQAATAGPTKKLIIFHAGSLSVPFAKIEKDFEALHPDVDVLREAGGSTKMARMISELDKPADIMGSADYAVIDKSLVPAKAAWNIRFATNRLVLCYTDKSRFAKEITADNWYEILMRDGVEWGHSDPNLDPCGYRSLMVLQLAEKHYKQEGLNERLVAGRHKRNIRPKSVELISLLKTGHMDYAWEYLSVAVQHGLNFIDLPDEVNLGNYRYDPIYRQASVQVTGKKPGTWITRKGKSCTYGITMINDSKNHENAIAFLDYLLNPQNGLKVLDEMGQPPFVPCRVSSEAARNLIPESIRRWVEVRN